MMTDPTYHLAGNILFRRAVAEDIPAATAILRQAAQQMMDEGKQQWDDAYPTEAHVRADVERGVGYVLEQDKKIIGYCAVMFEGEPAYKNIQGQWLSDKPYVVAHRMAVRKDKKGLGLGRLFMDTVARFAKDSGMTSFKVDTNFDNYAMLSLFEKLGFSYCGEIFYEEFGNDHPFRAFEKILG